MGGTLLALRPLGVVLRLSWELSEIRLVAFSPVRCFGYVARRTTAHNVGHRRVIVPRLGSVSPAGLSHIHNASMTTMARKQTLSECLQLVDCRP